MMRGTLISAVIAATIIGVGYGAYLIATAKDTRPPHWSTVCTEYESRTEMLPSAMAPDGVSMGGGWRIVQRSYCVATEKRCVVGKDYKGKERTCTK